MTATTSGLRSATPTGAAATARPRQRSRRWLRVVIPFAVALLLVTVSAVAYTLQQPDQRDPAFLSPTSDAPIGAAHLARLVTQRGVPVERVTRASDALVSAYRGGATLLIAAPSLVHPFQLRMLKLLPTSTRVVLVAPSQRTLALGRLPIAVADQRWAAGVAQPRCALPAAAQAGPAGVRRTVFTEVDPDLSTEVHRCYSGAVVEFGWHRTAITVVGASEAFRNDRIGEHGNAALATGLLTGSPRLIWLDLHRPEPRPGYVNDPSHVSDGAPPSLGPGSPDPDFPLPGTRDPGTGFRPGDDDGSGGAGSAQDRGPSLWSAFPQPAWAVLTLLLVAAALLAFARARRLGGPVTEPLPVTVPAAETVRGRGRLYQRAQARERALATVAAGVRERLSKLLDLPADAPTATLVTAVAAYTGDTSADVEAVLYPAAPADDAELSAAATAMTTLLHAVTGPGRTVATRPVPEESAPQEGGPR